MALALVVPLAWLGGGHGRRKARRSSRRTPAVVMTTVSPGQGGVGCCAGGWSPVAAYRRPSVSTCVGQQVSSPSCPPARSTTPRDRRRHEHAQSRLQAGDPPPRAHPIKREAMSYGKFVTVAAPFTETVQRMREELSTEGFGVLTEINVTATVAGEARRADGGLRRSGRLQPVPGTHRLRV